MTQWLQTKPAPAFADYLRDKARYADFINYFLFAGELLLYDRHLYNYDSDSSTVFIGKHIIMSANKSRDSNMLAQIDDQSVLIGIEHQQAIDYSIPYRILMYDVISYNQQFNLIDEYERKHFHPIPIITCVLYSGERRWNRPKSFSELITVPKCFKGKVNDWESYIYDIKDIDVEKLHHPDNRNLVDAVQKIYQWDKDIKNLPDMVMPKDVAIIVATITHQPELIERIEKEDKGGSKHVYNN